MLKRQNRIKPILLILAAVAVFARVYRFGSAPGGINQDEAMAAYDAFALSLYGTDRFGMFMPVHFTAWGYGQMSVLMSYLMTPFIRIFGLSVWTARLPALIVSLSGLCAVYLLAKELSGESAAVGIFGFCAINPWHIMQSRWALDCNMLPHFFLFGVFLLYKGIKNGAHKIYLASSMLCFALCMYAYGIAFYTVPLFLLAAAIYLMVGKLVDWRGAALCAGVYLLAAWPIFGVMIINFFNLPPLRTPFFTIPYFPGSIRAGDLLFFSGDPGGQFLRNVKALFKVAVLQKDGLPWNAIPDFGALYMISVPFVIIGIIGCISILRGRFSIRKAGVVLFAIWFAVALFSGIVVTEVNINRINIIFYPLIFLAGYGIKYTADKLSAINKYAAKAITTALVLSYGLLFISFEISYFTDHDKYLSYLFYKGWNESAAYALDATGLSETAAVAGNGDAVWDETSTGTLYITAYSQYEGAAAVSEILTLFAGKIDPRYFNGPDYAEHFRYTDFLNSGYAYNLADNKNRKDAFIFNADYERQLFPDSRYVNKIFGGYGVAIPR